MKSNGERKKFKLEPNKYLSLCKKYGKEKVRNAIKFWQKYYDHNTAIYDIMENKEFRIILDASVII